MTQTTKKDKSYKAYEYDLIEVEKKPTYFHIGQCYEKTPALRISCAKCGNDKFIVGQGSYYTALSCDICKWELCIHDG